MKRAAPWIALFTAVGGSAPTTACHELHACGERPCGRGGTGASGGHGGSAGTSPGGTAGQADHAGQPAGDAGSSQAGGDAGDAGDAGRGGGQAGDAAATAGAMGTIAAGTGGEGGREDEQCTAPRADCDESTFNGCESNLLADVRNCGACRALCVGACIEGHCEPFESLVDDLYIPARGGIARDATDVYAFSTVGSSLARWSESHGAQTLFTDGDFFDEILAGLNRVYLLGAADDAVSSYSGGTVLRESLSAKAAVLSRDTLYAVDSTGVPYSRSELGGETRALPVPEPMASDASVRLAATDYAVALSVEGGDDDDATYTLYTRETSFDDSPWLLLASGTGSPAQLRVGSLGIYIDVVLPKYAWWVDTWQVEHEVREIDFDGTTRVVASLTGLLDFELVDSNLFLSVELTERTSVLRVVPLDDPEQTRDVQTSASMASLTYAEPFFYFGDSSRKRLSRLRNWVE